MAKRIKSLEEETAHRRKYGADLEKLSGKHPLRHLQDLPTLAQAAGRSKASMMDAGCYHCQKEFRRFVGEGGKFLFALDALMIRAAEQELTADKKITCPFCRVDAIPNRCVPLPLPLPRPPKKIHPGPTSTKYEYDAIDAGEIPRNLQDR